QAQQLGANAIVNVRYATSSVAQGAAELYVYGTAVRIN
ncbi:MAG: heavy metal-binding domain-containing protein, partial [Deltaproteobacteria bacterium]|nr:heavy metal-binding domain-containing protein [Deltaproteobacteria bacterium]